MEDSDTTPKVNKVVGVKKFIADAPYDQDRIVYRESPYEVKFYNYRRWVNSPAEMLTEYAVSYLRSSGMFAGVCHAHSNQPVDYLLSGRVVQFEEWDQGNEWQAKIRLWLEVQSVPSRKIAWQGYVEKVVQVREPKPSSVVQALNKAAEGCFQQLTTHLSEKLKS